MLERYSKRAPSWNLLLEPVAEMMSSQTKRKFRVGPTQVIAAVFILIFIPLTSLLHLLVLPSNNTADAKTSKALSTTAKDIDSSTSDNRIKPKNSYHFLISSDCTSYQRWEVLTLLHSAQSIHQCGRYTWIISGCLQDHQADLGKGRGGANSDKLTHSSLLEEVTRHFPDITTSNNRTTAKESIGNNNKQDDCHTIHPHVHFTPDFTDMSIYGGPYADGSLKRGFVGRNGKLQRGNFGNTYPFNNKPNGLNHWIRDFLKSDERRDESVVLIDPDFLFLNKFDAEELVLKGKPAAAKYGLGAQFLDFNLTYICDRAPLIKAGSTEAISCPFTNVTSQEVNKYYSAGPPYIIHIEDVLSFSERWANLVPPTYDEYPLLYAEMFAYSMAAADLGLKHNLVKNLFAGCMTGWPHTHDKEDHDALQLSAKIYTDLIENDPLGIEATGVLTGASSCFVFPLSPPPFLHYCSRYSFVTPFSNGAASKMYHWFAKRHVDHNILDCSEHHEPLQPYLSEKPEKMEGGDKYWNVLAVCSIVRAINYAQRMGCEMDVSTR